MDSYQVNYKMEQINLPELRESEIDNIIEQYKAIYQNVMTLKSAETNRLDDWNANLIHTLWSQRNLELGTSRKISRSFLQKNGSKTCVEVATSDVSHWTLEAVTQSGQRRAIIQTIKDQNNKKYVLEIWSGSKCTLVFDLNILDKHGAVHTEGLFCSFCWSCKEDKVLYIAEEKAPETAPFYPQNSYDNVEGNDEIPIKRGEQFVYDDNWGETWEINFPKRQPVIMVCDINTKILKVLENVPSIVSPGQVIWAPFDDGVVGVGLINIPRRLGILSCTNRKSHIFWLSNSGEYFVLSDEKNYAVHSPQFSPNKKYLLWMQRPLTGGNLAIECVVKYDWITKEKTTIVDNVQNSLITKNGKEFFGFCYSVFLGKCHFWSAEGKFLIINTLQKYRFNCYAVDIESGDIWDIGSTDENQSTIVVGVTKDNYVLCNLTSYKEPSILCSFHLPSAVCEPIVHSPSWIPLTAPSFVDDKNVIYNFAVFNEKENAETCYATYYGPKSNQMQSIPVLLYMHGGPHIVVPSMYNPLLHFFTKLGFGIVIAHFRGSGGFGQRFMDLLIGKMGSVDVDDCYSTVQSALKKFSWLNPEQVVLYGGSSGGFIALHLVSKYPNKFKSVVTRNPIIDAYLRCFISDIPDWSFVVNGLPYEGLRKLMEDAKIRQKMFDISPIKYIKNVKTPILFLLGKRDLRYPPGPALAYHHILKELSVPTKVLFYEDNHNFTLVPVEIDHIINSVIWFKRCLNLNASI